MRHDALETRLAALARCRRARARRLRDGAQRTERDGAARAARRTSRPSWTTTLQCRGWAERQTGVPPEAAAGQDAAAGAVIGTAIGAATGALIGAAVGQPGRGRRDRRGLGPVARLGTGLLDRRWRTAASLQQRYDFAYTQCMYANGNQVPVARGLVPGPPPPTTARARRTRADACRRRRRPVCRRPLRPARASR